MVVDLTMVVDSIMEVVSMQEEITIMVVDIIIHTTQLALDKLIPYWVVPLQIDELINSLNLGGFLNSI